LYRFYLTHQFITSYMKTKNIHITKEAIAQPGKSL
jgi:hypothetical protein